MVFARRVGGPVARAGCAMDDSESSTARGVLCWVERTTALRAKVLVRAALRARVMVEARRVRWVRRCILYVFYILDVSVEVWWVWGSSVVSGIGDLIGRWFKEGFWAWLGALGDLGGDVARRWDPGHSEPRRDISWHTLASCLYTRGFFSCVQPMNALLKLRRLRHIA